MVLVFPKNNSDNQEANISKKLFNHVVAQEKT